MTGGTNACELWGNIFNDLISDEFHSDARTKLFESIIIYICLEYIKNLQ